MQAGPSDAEILNRSGCIDYSPGTAEYDLELIRWYRSQTGGPAAAIAQAVPVGEAGSMPGTSGFTMACFHADKVPLGTKLYAGAPAAVSAPAQTPRKPQLADAGVVPGGGLADWPAWCETFGERTAYQHGIADARAIAKLDTNKWREAVVRACMPTEACFDGSDPQKTLDKPD